MFTIFITLSTAEAQRNNLFCIQFNLYLIVYIGYTWLCMTTTTTRSAFSETNDGNNVSGCHSHSLLSKGFRPRTILPAMNARWCIDVEEGSPFHLYPSSDSHTSLISSRIKLMSITFIRVSLYTTIREMEKRIFFCLSCHHVWCVSLASAKEISGSVSDVIGSVWFYWSFSAIHHSVYSRAYLVYIEPGKHPGSLQMSQFD